MDALIYEISWSWRNRKLIMQLRTKVDNVHFSIKKKSPPCFASLQTVTQTSSYMVYPAYMPGTTYNFRTQREKEREMAAEQTSKTIEAIRWKVEMVSTATLTTLLTRYPSLYIRIPRILGRWQVYNLLFGFEISYSYSHTHFYPSVLGGLMSPVPIFLGLNKSQRSVTSTLVSSHTLLEW